ncbi:MAG TPA: efflux RND transporter periplasmic adaptor subunit [Vicinamibacterales bacterium]|jgi:RND family efflux transporter MFP subunit
MEKRTGTLIALALVLVAAAAAAYWGIASRAHAMDRLARDTEAMAITTVAVEHPIRGSLQQELVLPGTMQAFTDAPVYARTNGYLKARYVDIGSRVRAGQVLAEIDTPEIDQQLQQARADLETAKANEHLAEITAQRYQNLIKSESVSQQDLDDANGNLASKQATVDSALYNVKRLEQLYAFKRIIAPFAGVITARNVDVGALIDSGNSARELFHIADTSKLRVFVSVPEAYSREAAHGVPATLTLDEFPGRSFAGVITRTADAIDVSSRTMRTEIDVDNARRELLPGAYAQVHLQLPTPTSTFRLPVNALIFRGQGLQVATVDANSRIVLETVTPGRDLGTAIEIVSGLTGDESVVVNPPDSITTGEQVRVAAPAEGRS